MFLGERHGEKEGNVRERGFERLGEEPTWQKKSGECSVDVGPTCQDNIKIIKYPTLISRIVN